MAEWMAEWMAGGWYGVQSVFYLYLLAEPVKFNVIEYNCTGESNGIAIRIWYVNE